VDALQYHREQTRPINRTAEILDRARAALAEGDGVGPSDEGLLFLIGKVLGYDFGPGLQKGPQEVFGTTEELVELCRAVLARYGTHPRPIPVAERLPTEADCDAEGRCWFWESYMERWELDDRAHGINLTRVAWLPAAAIPLPEA